MHVLPKRKRDCLIWWICIPLMDGNLICPFIEYPFLTSKMKINEFRITEKCAEKSKQKMHLFWDKIALKISDAGEPYQVFIGNHW